MEKDPTSNPENNDIQTEYPSFEEHMVAMRDESGGNNNSPNNPERNVETIKSPEQRQVEDLEVLFSFCDEKDILDILKSDSYGTLLDNSVSLVDLFNANALFDEQYYSDGYTRDNEWRGEDDPNNVFHLLEVDEGRFHRDPMTKVHLKQKEHDYEKNRKIESRGVLLGKEKYDEYRDRRSESNNPDGDIIRADQAKKTINEIASLYFSDSSSSEKASEIKDIITARSNGDGLSEEQKAFLRNEQNFVADRLLYDGHVVNEERADVIFNTLKDAAENIGNKSELNEHDRGTLMCRMAYAKVAIDDFIAAEKPDLVYDAQRQLKDMVDKHFDILASTNMIEMGSDINRFDAIDGLIFGYSNPFLLAERAKEFGLCEKEYDWMNYDKYVIDNPDRIVDYLAEGGWWRNSNGDETLLVSQKAGLLKELGVSDEAILRNCHDLRPVDFVDTKSYYDGAGARLVEAGIDKKKIIKEVFSSTADHQRKSPFEKNNYPFEDESYVEVLERNGFDMTDIAKTFSPDTISSNLAEFIERGADVKELMKHMASYREEFEGNIVRNAKGDISEFHRMWFDGVQEMMIWDESHPEGKVVKKTGMRGRGIDYIAANINVFAENGISSDEIIEMINGNETSPFGMLIPRMLESGKYKTHEVLSAGYLKYVDYLKKMQEAGYFDEEYVKQSSDSSDYYSKIIEQMSGFPKKNRDSFYLSLIEAE